MTRNAEQPGSSAGLPFNKVCEIEDFSSPDLVPVMREVCAYKMARLSDDFPKGVEHRKDWEVAMAVRSLQEFGALHPQARILGVGAGTEDTVFFLTRHTAQVFATDRYLSPGAWRPLAPLSMMVEPDLIAPFDYDPNRLVVQHMDGRALRYPDDTFDGIFSSGSIEHFGGLVDVAAAAFEMGRVLKPGGILALSTEFRLSGPPGGVGWEGLTLVLSEENVRRYVVEASGLELVDDLRTEVSEATLTTPRDLTLVLTDHLQRVAAKGGVEEYAEWDFPHLILVQGGYVFGSVHLTLRKTDGYPASTNGWARPSEAILQSISTYNRSLLEPAAPPAEPGAEAPEAPAAPAARVAAPGADAAGDGPGDWSELVAQTDRDRTALHGAAEATRARSKDLEAQLHEVDLQLAAIDRGRREVDEHLATVVEQQAELERRGRGPTPATADPSELRQRIAGTGRSTRVCRQVSVNATTKFAVVLDLDGEDTVAQILSTGRSVDQTLLELMLGVLEPGQLMVDLGAHVGTFSLAAAAAGCRAVAVEASPVNVELLRTSVARNGFHQLQVVHAAATDRSGTVGFHARGPWGHIADGAMSPPAPAGTTISVPAVTVEDLLVEFGVGGPSFVKIDVEGSEIRALRGMAQLLAGREAPPVLVESNGHTLRFFDATPNDLLGTLDQLGYTSYLVEPGRLVRVSPREMQPQTLVDYLAVKRSPGALPGWRVETGMGFDERLRRIVADCAHQNPHHRAHMATALATTDDPISAHPEVAAALDALLRDDDEDVADAARRSVDARAAVTDDGEERLVRR